ncbi:MAG TPA: ABC transporter permease [Bryobacteraceae bacterium]|nr:ABC transporter permease [Bryobacteraceae bacterium]
MRRSPRRKAMTIGAVALGSAVATAMLGAMLDVGDRVNRELRSLGANLIVTPKSTQLPVEIGGVQYQPAAKDEFIPAAAVPKIKSIFWQLNITALAPSMHAQSVIGGRETPIEGVWFLRTFRTPDGLNATSGLRALNATWKVDGRWIDDSLPDDRADECIAGAAVARRLALKPGSVVALFGEPFTVAGILATGGEEEDRIFVRLEVLERLTHRAGQVDAIAVGALTKPEDAFARKNPDQMNPAEYDRWYCTPYITSIAHQIEQALPMAVARPIRRVADNEGRVLTRVRGLMLLISLAALATAALTVWSVMATTVLERRYEIAIMQATGAANWLLVMLFGAEAAIQGALGGVIGALAGAQLSSWVSRTVFGVNAEVPALLVPLVVLIAVAVALAGAAQPLRRALALEPAAMLREGA